MHGMVTNYPYMVLTHPALRPLRVVSTEFRDTSAKWEYNIRVFTGFHWFPGFWKLETWKPGNLWSLD
jgi:hypothetical protein